MAEELIPIVQRAFDFALNLYGAPKCATPGTWEARQGVRFVKLVSEIDACPSLAELTALGKRLYALPLSHD